MFRIAVTFVRGFEKFKVLSLYGSKLRILRRMSGVGTEKGSTYPDVVIPEVSLSKFMLDRIGKYGNKVAMIENATNKTLTFNQVQDQTIRCSRALYKAGLRKNSVVGLCTMNCMEYPIIQIAAAMCGATSTMCNPLLTEDEILKQFKSCQPSMVFTDACSLSKLENISKHLPCLQKVYVVGNHTGNNSFNDLLNSSDESEQNHIDEILIDSKKDVAFLPYSSGTTGLPKGVMLTHHNVIAAAVLTPFGCLALGVTNVLEQRYTTELLLDTVQRRKITHLLAVPPMLLAMEQTDLFDKYDTSSLKCVLYGGAPASSSTIKFVQNRYNVTMTAGYGLTECLPISLGEQNINSFHSAGSIFYNTKIKVIDVVTGKTLGPGEKGEILAKGPQRMKGYFNNPEATAEVIDEEGWLHTGDIGYYDEQGTLYLVDRLKELIKYKAFQIAPAELESVLHKHPEISDAAVIGIPDPVAGELPKAFVVRKTKTLTEEKVKKFVEGSVARYKFLRGGVTFIDSIPKTPSGKILRRELRNRK